MMDKILSEQIERGKADAIALRNAAPTMTDSELIASAGRIPKFNPEKDYSGWPVGAPVKTVEDCETVVYRLVTPHNAKDYGAMRPEYWKRCVEEEPAPTWNDQIEAQVTYTAMMTDTLLEV